MNGVVIIGAGLAGSRCAEALRAGGAELPITLVGAEPVGPYERPALSKEFLAGSRAEDDLFLRPPGSWGERGIDLRLGSPVERIDLGKRTVQIRGRELGWCHLVVATGARPRRLPGVAFPNVHHLRTLAGAKRLRAALHPESRLVVVGAGFVGAEVASTALGLGPHVTIIEAETAPLARVAGAEVGHLLADRWRGEGVSLRLGARIERVDPDSVALADGAVIPYDALLVAIGAEPASDLFGDPGGIETDACGRTAHDAVYACGDVARFEGRRLEHWTSASGQATAVASAILGSPERHVTTPYFWSDQFGLRLQMVGTTTGWSNVELEGDPASFRARYVDPDGNTLAILLGNRSGEVAAARRELARAA
jgi:NADPH-dependent 2,4-dienoyl-CoA reductase/sulfur reductase-like enzyme